MWVNRYNNYRNRALLDRTIENFNDVVYSFISPLRIIETDSMTFSRAMIESEHMVYKSADMVTVEDNEYRFNCRDYSNKLTHLTTRATPTYAFVYIMYQQQHKTVLNAQFNINVDTTKYVNVTPDNDNVKLIVFLFPNNTTEEIVNDTFADWITEEFLGQPKDYTYIMADRNGTVVETADRITALRLMCRHHELLFNNINITDENKQHIETYYKMRSLRQGARANAPIPTVKDSITECELVALKASNDLLYAKLQTLANQIRELEKERLKVFGELNKDKAIDVNELILGIKEALPEGSIVKVLESTESRCRIVLLTAMCAIPEADLIDNCLSGICRDGRRAFELWLKDKKIMPVVGAMITVNGSQITVGSAERASFSISVKHPHFTEYNCLGNTAGMFVQALSNKEARLAGQILGMSAKTLNLTDTTVCSTMSRNITAYHWCKYDENKFDLDKIYRCTYNADFEKLAEILWTQQEEQKELTFENKLRLLIGGQV